MTRPVPLSRRVLLLTPATSYRTADFLRAAARLNTEVIVGTDQALVSAALAPDRILRLDFGECAASVSRIVAHLCGHPVAAVVGVDEVTTLIAAAASQALGLAHNSVASVRVCHNKYAFRRALKKTGLPSPSFQLVALADLESTAPLITYPCVLKPLGLSGSRGVMRADSPTGFVAAGKRIARILDNLDGLPQSLLDALLCEDFLPGREVAVEGLLQAGRLTVLALFDKPDPLDGPTFAETIYVTPSRLAQTIQDEVNDAVSDACRALGLHTGPVHAELRINDAGVWLIELAARSIGGRCARSLRFGRDTRLEELILRLALGETMALDDDSMDYKRESDASGVMMLPMREAGQLRAITGVEAARAVPGINDVIIEVRPGEQLVPLPEGDRYLGFLFARGLGPRDVEQALRSAAAKIRVELEPS